MILQIDERLRSDIWWNESGCGLMTIFYFINKFTNYSFHTANILDIGNMFRKLEYVSEEFFINQWEKCFNFFPGFKVHYTNKHETPNRICAVDEFEILDWYSVNSGKRHFTAGEGHGIVTYDSMGESKVVQEGFLRSKRVFRRIS